MACIFALTVLAAPAAAAPPTPARDARSAVKSAAQREPSPEAKTAFLALSEADRKAMQDALGWLGFYNGVVDGAFGKRTIEALVGYQQSLAATADGVVTSKQLAALKSAAAKSKADVGFRLADDPATGVRFGAPFKLLDKRESGAGFTNLSSAGGDVGLYLKETSGDLATLYNTQIAAPNRKTTYKYLRPDAFFVVAGEEGDKKFYRRYAAAPTDAASRKTLHGFAFLYPKARAKSLDPVALAVANAFEPFPSAAPSSPVASVTPSPASTPTPSPRPEPARLTAVALVVMPGVAVTTLPPSQCKAPTVEGKPAHFLDGGDAAGLFRLAGAFGERGASPAIADDGEDLVALSLTQVGETKTELQVASAAPAPGGQGRIVLATLGSVATGSPLFDRRGRLVGFIAPGQTPTRRADVMLAEPHLTISAAGISAGKLSGAEATLSAPQIAARMRDAVVGVFCGP